MNAIKMIVNSILSLSVFLCFTLPCKNILMNVFRVLTPIFCTLSGFYNFNAKAFWAHIIPSIILFNAGTHILIQNRFPIYLKDKFFVHTVSLSVLLLLIAEVYSSRLASLHSICHIFIFLPVISLTEATIIKNNASKPYRVIHDITGLFMIGAILVYHKHDTRPIAMLWHRLMGIGMIMMGFLYMTYFVDFKFSKLFIAWFYFVLSAFMFEMAMFLYMYNEDYGVVGFHNFWKDPDPNESICLYSAIAICVGGLITICISGNVDEQPFTLKCIQNWKDYYNRYNHLNNAKSCDPNCCGCFCKPKYKHCDPENPFTEKNVPQVEA